MMIESFFVEQDKYSMPNQQVESQHVATTNQLKTNVIDFVSISLPPMKNVFLMVNQTYWMFIAPFFKVHGKLHRILKY